jgi:hypothetical protein
MIIHQVETAYPTSNISPSTAAGNPSYLQQYISSPNITGDTRGDNFLQTASYPVSGPYTAQAAQSAAQVLYNTYQAEKTGYSLLANQFGIRYEEQNWTAWGTKSLTVNGVTYSNTGTVGNNPSRTGYYYEFVNNAISGGLAVNVQYNPSTGQIYSLLNSGN